MRGTKLARGFRERKSEADRANDEARMDDSEQLEFRTAGAFHGGAQRAPPARTAAAAQ